MLSLLAQAAPTVPPESFTLPLTREVIVVLVLGGLCVGLPAIIGAINGALQIVKFFRPNPPVHKEYATKSELTTAETRLQGNINKQAAELSSMEERINKARNSMEERLKAEISGLDDGVQKGNNALQKELHSIQRTLGQLEGKLDSRRRA